jgi:hypothetical protein
VSSNLIFGSGCNREARVAIPGTDNFLAVIVSKPRTSTLVSFTFFLIITLGVLIMNLLSIQRTPAWYNYAVAGLLTPLFLFVFWRIFVQYKVVKMGDQKVEISFPVLRKKRTYPLREVVGWKENAVKTGRHSVFKEMEIQFADRSKLTVGNKEHSEYNRMVGYLSRKLPGKKQQ